MYVLTAAHCLYEDGDQFAIPYENIQVLFYSKREGKYVPVDHKLDHRLASPLLHQDVAVLNFERNVIEQITGSLPAIKVIQERYKTTEFVCKGFPSAANGEELITINPIWSQHIATDNRFHLSLKQDFSSEESAKFEVDGFSGCGIFLVDGNDIYLFGLFTRFLDSGKIIYGQYISTVNDLLRKNFLQSLAINFFGGHGMTHGFFERTTGLAIKDLGPRFSEQLNFQLPIARQFNDLAKDAFFRLKITQAVDVYLSASTHGSQSKYLEATANEYELLKNSVSKWFSELDWNSYGKIETDTIRRLISNYDNLARERQNELHEEEDKIRKADNGKTEFYKYSSPLQSEINWLRETQENNRTLTSSLGEINIQLSNNGILILTGEAGAGKSHLLGDIAINRTRDNGLPFILLLGQHFKREKLLSENVLNLLGLSCNFTEFLETLNEIGKQIGQRVIIAIDAINEGAGKELWRDALAGFIHDVRQFPFIGLVISIRDTYIEEIIPDGVREDPTVEEVKHEGFRGNEYFALKAFCDYYGITQPNFPLMFPEYSNPLFLNLICQGVASSTGRIFPQGYHGITQIFDLYKKAIIRKLSVKRDEYKLKTKLFDKVLEEFSAVSYKQEHWKSVPLEETEALFETKFPNLRMLLSDLIEEGVFIRRLRENYRTDEVEEVVYFSYERLGDYFTAEKLLKEYSDVEAVKKACQRENTLGKLVGEWLWRNRGIMECFSVLLPEKFGLEIVEAYDWVFDNTESLNGNFDQQLNYWLFDGFKWRSVESFDNEKLSTWLRDSGNFRLDKDNWLYYLFELTGIKEHPFNSDRLFRILSRLTMAERDGFFQSHMRGYSGYDDDGVAQPITRLIDWAWQPNISRHTDSESARLCGQTLCWLLSSTNRDLRDQVTKALVNLLQYQTEALLKIIEVFHKIDDFYILERVYAVAYGCSLRTSTDSLRFIGESVFNYVFKDKNPPEHILLRDYARNTIEYALSLGINLNCSAELIRPPYSSKLPSTFPTAEEVQEKYRTDHNDADYQNDYAETSNRILYSVLDGDFSRYTISSALNSFVPLRFTFNNEYEDFTSALPRGGKALLKESKGFFEYRVMSEKDKARLFNGISESQASEIWRSMDSAFEYYKKKLFNKLNDAQRQFFTNEVLPHWRTQFELKNGVDLILNHEGIKAWIVQQVFEMGYDSKVHGRFDSSHHYYEGRFEHKLERIGKKYQWIAFHRILALLADNHKIRDRWSRDTRGKFYKGPWELMLRDIDPSFITKKNDEPDIKDDFGIVKTNPPWWSMDDYHYWNRAPADWGNSISDLPEAINAISRRASDSKEWLYLKLSNTWQEPKPIGSDRWSVGRKEIWYSFQAYLVPKHKLSDTIRFLTGKNFFGRWLPEERSHTELLARENYWSPISKQAQKETYKWHRIRDSSIDVMLATESAVGSLDSDYSGAHFSYSMPCQKLFDGLDLRYSEVDGYFEDSSGKVVVMNDSKTGCFIEKASLIKFLRARNMEIVWTFLGEKNFFSKGKGRQDYRKSLSGVYYLQDGNVVGNFDINDW